jgi:hypothetical protein
MRWRDRFLFCAEAIYKSDDERKHRSNEEEEDYNLISPSCSLAKSDAIFFWRCLISYSRVVVGERLIRIRDDEFRDFR